MEKIMNSSKKNVENKGFKKCKNHLMKGKEQPILRLRTSLFDDKRAVFIVGFMSSSMSCGMQQSASLTMSCRGSFKRHSCSFSTSCKESLHLTISSTLPF